MARPDGKQVFLPRKRAHLLVCAKGCCCGRTDRGHPAVPVDFYKSEYARRKLRSRVQLTMSGCVGPCPMLNVALLVFDGRPLWFQAIDAEPQIVRLYDYIEAMLEAGGFLPVPSELLEYRFDYYLWGASDGVLPPPAASAKIGDASGSVGASRPGILLLTHADTDLTTLREVVGKLPEGFPPVAGVGLGKMVGDEYMDDLTAAHGEASRVIVARILGEPSAVPGLRRLSEFSRANGRFLILVSGTGTPDPELTARSTVPPAIVHETTAYLRAGGAENLSRLLRFLADHLLMTGFGYEPPQEIADVGVYHPDLRRGATWEEWNARRDPKRPVAGILFYRAHWLSGNLAFIDSLVRAIEAQGMTALPVFAASLKQARSENGDVRRPAAFEFFRDENGATIDVLISTMSFALNDADPVGVSPVGRTAGAMEELDVPVIQAIPVGTARWRWEASARGLNPLDTAMNVALPEFDGRIVSVPVCFKEPLYSEPDALAEIEAIRYVPLDDRVDRVAGLAARHAILRRKPNAEKRIAVILTNSSGKASKIGNAVGLDAPASLLNILHALKYDGYSIKDLPADGDRLIADLIDRCSYDETYLTPDQLSNAAGKVSAESYADWFEEMGESRRIEMIRQWGDPPGEAYRDEDSLALAGLEFGNVFVALQPPRGYGMDPSAIYHRPDLPPTHHYHAFYRWLRDGWKADAIVHLGKHGTLEWLPGKSVGLSKDCFPDALLGDLPLFYPFIVNDPGEGAQAKRRAHAVILDHLVPPLTTAEVHGSLAELALLVDEYYQVELLDPSKLPLLQQRIWNLIQEARLEEDLKYLMRSDHGDHTHEWDEGTTPEGTPLSIANLQAREFAHLIEDLDGYLCELAGAQIRDGLHILGDAPQGERLANLLQAITRLPGIESASLRDTVAACFGLVASDLIDDLGGKLSSPHPLLSRLAARPLVTKADALETIDEIGLHLLTLLVRDDFSPKSVDRALRETFGFGVENEESLNGLGALAEVLDYVRLKPAPALARTTDEIGNLLRALNGGHVPAGPSGAPTRGMAHVLPTGRNFYAVDPRALPSRAAYEVGKELARQTVERHLAETGSYPETVGISLWGTSAMRTQGDDVAHVLALLGVRPVWQRESRRVIGVEALPIAELGRPRVDVVVRISGFFRDAFPHLIAILDEAVELVAGLDETQEDNPLRKHYLADLESTELGEDRCEANAERQARYRIFGAKPGAYGAGILPLIDEKNWSDSSDLAEAYVNWGGYAYTADEQGVDARDVFRVRLSGVQIALHNQDNREHDLFDSDDYFQFHGGMIAAIQALGGRKPRHYFGDTQNPARPVVRDLKQETLRVFRSRVINPKWIEGIRRHGYKGGLELSATVDYLFGYDATAGLIDDWMYAQVAEKYLVDPVVRDFLDKSNPWALKAIAERLLEAESRGLWADPDPALVETIRGILLDAETDLEARGEPHAETRPPGGGLGPLVRVRNGGS